MFSNKLMRCQVLTGFMVWMFLGGIASAADFEVAPGTVVVEEDFPADSKFNDQPGVKPMIPLDTEDPTYDMWKTMRSDLAEGRDPGPIDIQRMPFGLGYTGIPTFFRLPIALTPEDLKVGDVDVAFLRAYTDMGMGQRGANRGPTALRASAAEYVSWGAASMAHI